MLKLAQDCYQNIVGLPPHGIHNKGTPWYRNYVLQILYDISGFQLFIYNPPYPDSPLRHG
jgi:hypothetical protein